MKEGQTGRRTKLSLSSSLVLSLHRTVPGFCSRSSLPPDMMGHTIPLSSSGIPFLTLLVAFFLFCAAYAFHCVGPRSNIFRHFCNRRDARGVCCVVCMGEKEPSPSPLPTPALGKPPATAPLPPPPRPEPDPADADADSDAPSSERRIKSSSDSSTPPPADAETMAD